MQNLKRPITLLLILVMALTFLAACGDKATPSTDPTAAPTPASTDAAVTPTEEPEAVAPGKLTVFLCSSGIAIPEDIDPNDNPYINALKELANVEITEMTIPPYTDFSTKLNLVLASADMPDIIHSNDYAVLSKAGYDGAFIDLTDYIADSELLSSKFSPERLELMKYSDGRIYTLRSLAGVAPNALIFRQDIAQSVGYDKIPVTLDDWYELFTLQKAASPESVPMSAYLTTSGMGTDLESIYQAYGVLVTDAWQYYDGRYISAFEAPHQKDALLFVKKLYDEGLLSKTFLTNAQQDYLNDVYNNESIYQANSLISALAAVGHFSNPERYGDVEKARAIPVPYATTNLPDVDPIISVPTGGAIGWHGISISVKCQEVDAAVRFLEVLVSDENETLTSWGLQGMDYEGEGETRTVTDDAADRAYRLMYGFMFAFGSKEHLENGIPKYFANINPDVYDEYVADVRAGIKSVEDYSATVDNVKPRDFTIVMDETILLQRTEARELAKALILKAIVGEISLEEYDQEVAKYLETYKAITEEYNRVFDEVKGNYGY